MMDMKEMMMMMMMGAMMIAVHELRSLRCLVVLSVM
jgi:hypothetical protein